jgi:hypothetical protein
VFVSVSLSVFVFVSVAVFVSVGVESEPVGVVVGVESVSGFAVVVADPSLAVPVLVPESLALLVVSSLPQAATVRHRQERNANEDEVPRVCRIADSYSESAGLATTARRPNALTVTGVGSRGAAARWGQRLDLKRTRSRCKHVRSNMSIETCPSRPATRTPTAPKDPLSPHHRRVRLPAAPG